MRKTVFVLGAGASNEAKLPIGSELTGHIASAVNHEPLDDYGEHTGDTDIFTAASKKGASRKTLEQAAAHICDAMPQAISIDNFLDAHRENEAIEILGKLAIVKTILQAEKNSILYLPTTGREEKFDFRKTASTWYNRFWQLLTENCRADDLDERLSEVGLIVFNYDRCIEYYLLESFQNYYRLPPERAAELVESMAIYHPYGSVGSPRLRFSGPGLRFGATVSADDLLSLAAKIKTFTEGTDEESSEIVEIRQLMQEAARIVFLGFAYHPLNVRLLCPEPFAPVSESPKLIIGTAYRQSAKDKAVISDDLQARTGATEVEIRTDLKCAELMDEYFRTLSYQDPNLS